MGNDVIKNIVKAHQRIIVPIACSLFHNALRFLVRIRMVLEWRAKWMLREVHTLRGMLAHWFLALAQIVLGSKLTLVT